MIRATILILALALTGCVQNTGAGGNTARQFSPAIREIAAQRMRFVAEAVCLNNASRAAQDSAARALGFPERVVRDGLINYVNPGTQTYVLIGPAPEQSFSAPEGRRTFRGNGCSVGSPAVDTDRANQIVGEILAPLLVDGAGRLSQPIGDGTGRNAEGGIGFFFENLVITLPPVETTFTNDQTGERRRLVYPAILFVHN